MRTLLRRKAHLRSGAVLLSATALSVLAGCHHRQQARIYVPPPPSLGAPAGSTRASAAEPAKASPAGQASGVSEADLQFVRTHAPLWSETGTASWYGPPYNRRRGANGQIFDQDAMTAAHRTLPMNSLVRVTNVATGKQAVMRITDRGPFVPGRILDLSMASAKVTGVYLPGTATVRVDVYQTPSPIDTGGRWCVQIGAFHHESEAEKLKEHLQHQYQTANVIEFAGPTGHWVRIRPPHDDKERAVEIAKDLRPREGEAYLVRLD